MEDLKLTLQKVAAKNLKRASNPNLHSDLHALVEEVRTRFGETAPKGAGSFGFYLGFFKRLGVDSTRRLLKEVEEGTPDDPKRLFWWKVKNTLSERSNNSQDGAK